MKFAEAINANERYREAGKDFVGRIRFVVRGDIGSANLKLGELSMASLELVHGKCVYILTGDNFAEVSADFVLDAGASMWESVISGEDDFFTAILDGRIEFTGDMKKIIPHLEAAAELIYTAREMIAP